MYLHLRFVIEGKIAPFSERKGKKPRSLLIMATKHQLEKGMLQPSNPWNPDKSVGSSSSKKNLYSSDIGAKISDSV